MARSCVGGTITWISDHRDDCFDNLHNPRTDQLRNVGYASVEHGMQEIILTNGSTEAALDHPAAVFTKPKICKKAAKLPAQRKKAKR